MSNQRSTIKFTICLATALALAFSTPAGATHHNEPSLEGEATLRCSIGTPDSSIDCAPGYRYDPTAGKGYHELLVGTQSSVRFVVEWEPLTPQAEKLMVTMLGNYSACQHEASSCWVTYAIGESPLIVTLDGAAASNTVMEVRVQAAPTCEYSGFPLAPDCEAPYYRPVVNQLYSFKWIVQ